MLFVSIILSCGKEKNPVAEKSDAKNIIKFEILGIAGEIDEATKRIAVEFPHGSDVTAVKPYLTISAKATVTPASATIQDFTNPIDYVVTAEDGSIKTYSASINIRDCVYDDVYKFNFGAKKYEIIKANATWSEALSCAVERGGYLTEINSDGENNAIFEALKDASLDKNKNIAADGGGASYIWIGASDLKEEGKWIWDHTQQQFWEGNATGSSTNDMYNNWGNEPDDFGGQDCLGIAITEWPLGSGSLGQSSQWNDVKCRNTLYYIVEFD